MKIENPDVQFCSGFGQYHSPNNEKDPRPYNSITLSEIFNMIKSPQSVDKSYAQWCIFTDSLTRAAAELKGKASFYCLWADVDDLEGASFKEVETACESILGQCDYAIYTTRSATIDNPKSRIIVPLDSPLSCAEYKIYQQLFNDMLQEKGIKPDRATEKPNQICFLPNRSEYYETHISDASTSFKRDAWQTEYAQKKQEIERINQANHNRVAEASQRRFAKIETQAYSPIDACREEFQGEALIALAETFGFERQGKRLLSPLSRSGNPGVVLSDDGERLISAHTSDANAGIGKQSERGDSRVYDAFDLIKYFQHGNDEATALKALGSSYTINGISITNHNQIEYMKNIDPELVQASFDKEKPFVPDLEDFALNGMSEELERQMLEDKFILGQLAILGQITVFYAKPNAGKTLLTLWLLIESIKCGEIDGNDVFYINYDDNHKGITEKLKLAEQYNFYQLAPGYNNFRSDDLLNLLKQRIQKKTARGTIIILDTLKKFTDIMDKKGATDFSKVVREFVSHGGSAIFLAHVNKHRGEDDKVIYSGTSDIVDDADCAYTIDIMDEDVFARTVKFDNFKNRGDVLQTAAYRYEITGDYVEILQSVEPLSAEEEQVEAKRTLIANRLESDKQLIATITNCIQEGHNLKTELIAKASERSDLSKREVKRVLEAHEGADWDNGHRWTIKIGSKNAHRYELLDFPAEKDIWEGAENRQSS